MKLVIDRYVIRDVLLLGWLLAAVLAVGMLFMGVPLWAAALTWFLSPFATLAGMVIGNELPV